jgi:hypothetical protein
MSIESDGGTIQGKTTTTLVENLLRCHFVHYKSKMYLPGLEPGEER